MIAWEALLLYRRSVRRSVRLPSALLTFLIAPLLLLWILFELFSALPQVITRFPAPDYLTFIGPAVAMAGVLPGALWCGASLLTDRKSGLMEQFLAAPIVRAAIPFSNTLTAATGAILASLVVVLAAILCGMQVHSGLGGVLAMLPLSIALAMVYTNVAFLLALLVRYRGNLVLLCGAVLAATLLISDIILPDTLLPKWLTALAMLNPLSYAVQAARTLVSERPAWATYNHDLAVLICVAVGMLLASTIGFNRYAEHA